MKDEKKERSPDFRKNIHLFSNSIVCVSSTTEPDITSPQARNNQIKTKLCDQKSSVAGRRPPPLFV